MSFCQKCHKSTYPNRRAAGKALMYIWGNDPSADLRDLHVYECPHLPKDKTHYHIGHRSYYQKTQERIQNNVEIIR